MACDVKSSAVQWCFKYSNMTGFSWVLSQLLVVQPVYLRQDLRSNDKGDFRSKSLRGPTTLKPVLQTCSSCYFQHFPARLHRLSYPYKRRNVPVHPMKTILWACATHIRLYKLWIPFPSLFLCLCHAHNTDPR